MDPRDLDALMKVVIAPVVREYAAAAVAPLLDKISTQEARIKELEARPVYKPESDKKIANATEVFHADWAKEKEVMAAEARAALAETKVENAEMRAYLRDFAIEQSRQADEALAAVKDRVDDKLATVRNGNDVDPKKVAEIVTAQITPEINGRIAKAIAEIPLPEAKGPDPDEVRGAIKAEIKSYTDTLPGPEHFRDMVATAVRSVLPDEVTKAVTALPKPKDGVSPDPKEIARLVTDEVTKAVAALPKPKDGVSPDPKEIARLVTDEVTKAVTALPKPKDGVSPDPKEIARLVTDEVTKAVAALPKPKDGVSPDPKEIARLVTDEVTKAVTALPKPKDGVSPDPKEIARLVTDEVTKAVAALPKPKDGVSPDPKEIARLVTDEVTKAVAALPKPKDGVSPDPKEIARLVTDEVTKAVTALPKPKDGVSPDPKEIARLVTDEVTKAVAALPKPKDGRGVQRTFINNGGQLVVVYTDGSTDELDRVVGKDGRNADEIVIERVAERLVNMSDQWRGKDGTSIFDAGVWTQSGQYDKGAGVTFAGSFWISQEDGNKEKPGAGKAWRLAVKKGRDARKPPKDEGDE